MEDKIIEKQKIHIKELSEKLNIIRNESIAIMEIFNAIPIIPGIQLNPIRERILDIYNLTYRNRITERSRKAQ